MSLVVSFLHQTSYLEKLLPKVLLQEFFNQAIKRLSESSSCNKQSPTQQGHAVFAAMYAVFRHSRWRNTALFQEVLRDFLVTEYLVSNQSAGKLLDYFIEASLEMNASGDKSIVPCDQSDHDFIRYLFVKSSASKSQSLLLADLGLGSSILRKIRQVAEASFKSKQGVKAQVFSSELDAVIYETVLELAAKLKTCPWTLDLYQLESTLSSSIGQKASVDSNELLHILTALSLKKSFTQDKLQPALATDASPHSLEVVLFDLSRADLVFCPDKSGKVERRLWHTTTACHELVAQYFASKVFTQQKQGYTYAALPGAFQKAIIKNLSGEDIENWLLKIKSGDVAFHPESLGFLAQAAVKAGRQELAKQTLLALLSKSQPYWNRKAVCQAIAAISTSIEAAKILNEVAASEQSLSVQSTILELL